MSSSRVAYPSGVSDDKWALVAPYLTPLREDAGQGEPSLRAVFADAALRVNGLRYMVKKGAPWRWMSNDLPPWEAVHQQAQRWLWAGCFAQLADDLRALLRLAFGRDPEPGAAILDSRTLRSTPERGQRAGYDGAKHGFVLLPRRWVVERSFAWATRFRRLVKDYERDPTTLADLPIVAFVCLMLKQAACLASGP